MSAQSETGQVRAVLRDELRPGDLGWIVEQHGVLYAREYGWNMEFEALVAQIAAAFVENHDPAMERCWIAELDGQRVGSVMLVRESEEAAKLRLLLVDPAARGQGIGKLLVETCLNFARRCGYQTVSLWTNELLVDARRLYQRAGFRLVDTEPHFSFGHHLVGETWELRL